MCVCVCVCVCLWCGRELFWPSDCTTFADVSYCICSGLLLCVWLYAFEQRMNYEDAIPYEERNEKYVPPDLEKMKAKFDPPKDGEFQPFPSRSLFYLTYPFTHMYTHCIRVCARVVIECVHCVCARVCVCAQAQASLRAIWSACRWLCLSFTTATHRVTIPKCSSPHTKGCHSKRWWLCLGGFSFLSHLVEVVLSHTHTHTHTHTHAHTHAHTHTHTLSLPLCIQPRPFLVAFW